jgi:hypothetical protein
LVRSPTIVAKMIDGREVVLMKAGTLGV